MASGQVKDTAPEGSGAFTSQQQLQHEQEIKQLLQYPQVVTSPPNPPTGESHQDQGARHPNTHGMVGSEGTAHGYPKIRVKPPGTGQEDGRGDASQNVHQAVGDVWETSKGATDAGAERVGDHSQGASGIGRQDLPSRNRPQWNGESSQGRADPGRGRMEGNKGHNRFDASRHRGIDGQDPLAVAGEEPMDGPMRGNMMRNYEPVIGSSNDPQSPGHWSPTSRHKTPESYPPKAVDRLDPVDYGHSGDFLNHGNPEVNKLAVHSDDGGGAGDSADYNYRYYKVHHPDNADTASHTPMRGFDKGYVVGGGDKGPWRKTGHFSDSHPSGYGMSDNRAGGAGNDKNRAGYNYYPRNPDQDGGRADYDSYYDNSGKKGYYSNGDGPGLFLPYRHHEVFDYYAPETGTS